MSYCQVCGSPIARPRKGQKMCSRDCRSEGNRRPLEQRFWEKVSKTETCWTWTGAVSNNYGSFCTDGRQVTTAHRVAYELLVGPIPDGLHLDHLCRNTVCVNPAHLEPVTFRENIRRSPLSPENRTHCPQDHPYSPENTAVYNGVRFCRTCYRFKNRERKRRKRAVA